DGERNVERSAAVRAAASGRGGRLEEDEARAARANRPLEACALRADVRQRDGKQQNYDRQLKTTHVSGTRETREKGLSTTNTRFAPLPPGGVSCRDETQRAHPPRPRPRRADHDGLHCRE